MWTKSKQQKKKNKKQVEKYTSFLSHFIIPKKPLPDRIPEKKQGFSPTENTDSSI